MASGQAYERRVRLGTWHRSARRWLFGTLPIMAVSIAVLATCSDPVNVETVAGSYVATTFTATEAGEVDDLLAGGAYLGIALSTAGTVSGRLLVPGGDEGGGSLDVNLTGTWSLDGSVVEFQLGQDTFLNNVSFLVSGSELIGERAFGSSSLRVILRR